MQGHLSAAVCLLNSLQRIIALTTGFPADAMFGCKAGATCEERYLVRHDERRIETDAELTNQMRILGLVAGQGTEELAGTGFCDRAYEFDYLFPGHATTVI